MKMGINGNTCWWKICILLFIGGKLCVFLGGEICVFLSIEDKLCVLSFIRGKLCVLLFVKNIEKFLNYCRYKNLYTNLLHKIKYAVHSA